MSGNLEFGYHGVGLGQREHFGAGKLQILLKIGVASHEVGVARDKVGGAAQRCSRGSKLANNRNFDYSESTFVYYFLKEKCLKHPKTPCTAILLLV